MPLLSHVERYEHRIIWSILNFHTCPSWPNLVITSPEFDIRLLDVLTLKFSLQTQGPGNGMCFAVHCVGNVDGYKAHHPALNVGVVVPIAEKLSTSNIVCPSRPRTLPLIPNAVAYFGLDGVHPNMPLNGGKLVLNVTLRTTVKQEHYWSTMFDPHMVALSNDLVSMVTRPAHTNCVIVSDQPVTFDTHSCMLRARMPVLHLRDVSMSDTGSSSDDSGRPVDDHDPVFETGMSTETTRMLVFYLYGRIASTIPENQIVKLQNFAQRYELKDLENMLTLYPSEYLLGTSLVMEEMAFKIAVADLKENYRSPKIKNPKARNIAASYTTFSDQHMQFTFYLASYPQAPVNMKLTIMLKNASGQVLKEHLHWHTITTGKKKTWISPRFVALGLVDVHLITCRIQMIEGRFDHTIANTREKRTGALLVYNNTLTFSEQLKKLYKDQVGCDFKLHVVGSSRVFNVHKAIVVARSPMIRRRVKAKERKPHDRSVVMIKLDDKFLPEFYEKVIVYMYCGRIDPTTKEHAYILARVADYFDMPFLVEHLIFLTKK